MLYNLRKMHNVVYSPLDEEREREKNRLMHRPIHPPPPQKKKKKPLHYPHHKSKETVVLPPSFNHSYMINVSQLKKRKEKNTGKDLKYLPTYLYIYQRVNR